jgi:hypothetical protein
LKILLGQQELDKPFTGGFGRYKLYALALNNKNVNWIAASLALQKHWILTMDSQ